MTKISELSDALLNAFCPQTIMLSEQPQGTNQELGLTHSYSHHRNFALYRDIKNFSFRSPDLNQAHIRQITRDLDVKSKNLAKVLNTAALRQLSFKETICYDLILEVFGSDIHTKVISPYHNANAVYLEEDGTAHPEQIEYALLKEKLRRLCLHKESFTTEIQTWNAKLKEFCADLGPNFKIQEDLHSRSIWRTYTLTMVNYVQSGLSGLFALEPHPTDINKIKLVRSKGESYLTASYMSALSNQSMLKQKLSRHFEIC